MNYKLKPFYLSYDDLQWVEATHKNMTTAEKLEQVFVDMFWNDSEKDITNLVSKHNVGGFRYNNQSGEKIYRQNAAVQSTGKIPALIAANVEAGGNGAVSGGTKIGDGIAIAATKNVENAYYMGYYGCKEAAAVGCNWSFAPVVDVDFNWRNCVIPTRCFGNDPETVAEMSLAYMKGAHDAGVACCMKHFPGDGCDDRDQHLVTTVNTLSCEEWDESFGMIYKRMIDAGVPSVMIGHIQQPAYSRKLRPGIADGDIMPATLAPELLKGLLREKLGFNGLIITDATHMVGLTSKMRRADFLPTALMSGCDMILYFRDRDEDFQYLNEALKDGRLTMERLDEAVKTVLAFKAMLKLHKKKEKGTLMPPASELKVIGCKEHKEKATEILDQSITLVKNTKNQLPLSPEKHKRVIIYSVEDMSLVSRIMGKPKCNKILAEELGAKGFEPTIYKLNPIKYITPKGINGKKVLADIPIEEFKTKYDAVILLANVASFSVTNQRNLHWKIPMGPEVPWYVTEVPTVFISVAHPFHLFDVPMMPTFVNTYNSSREAIRRAIEKLMGQSEFKGESPVDVFCGMWDTKL